MYILSSILIASMRELILRKDTIFWLKVASVNHCINNLNAKQNYTKCIYKNFYDIYIFFNVQLAFVYLFIDTEIAPICDTFLLRSEIAVYKINIDQIKISFFLLLPCS